MNALESLSVCVVAVLVCSVGAWGGISPEWINATNGEFLEGTNWSDGAAPVTADDTANFDTGPGDAYTVTFSGDVANDTVNVRNDNVEFDVGAGNTYTLSSWFYTGNDVTDTGALTLSSGTITTPYGYVGYYGGGALNITGGASFEVTSYNFCVARCSGSNGSIVVDGAGSSFTSEQPINVGRKGPGTFTIENGGSASFCVVISKYDDGDGTLIVGRTGSGTLNSVQIYVGGEGDLWHHGVGYFIVGPGGTVNTSVLKVQIGTLTLEGGTITSDKYRNEAMEIYVNGRLEGEGTLSMTGAGGPRIESDGTISPDGSTRTITITGGDLVMTRDGTEHGTLELEFDAASCDLIQLTTPGKSIDLDGATLDFEGSGLTGSETGQYDFLTADTISGFGALAGNDIDTVMLGLGFAPGTWDLFVEGDPGSGQSLRLTYVPEPASAIMLMVGLTWIVRRRAGRR